MHAKSKRVAKIIQPVILALLLWPYVSSAAYFGTQYAGAVSNILNPTTLFDALKRNITIQIPSFQQDGTNTPIEVPSPQKTLQDASPKLQQVNKDVKTETGIDLAKFIGWFAKMLVLIFQAIADFLKTVSKSLDPNVQ